MFADRGPGFHIEDKRPWKCLRCGHEGMGHRGKKYCNALEDGRSCGKEVARERTAKHDAKRRRERMACRP